MSQPLLSDGESPLNNLACCGMIFSFRACGAHRDTAFTSSISARKHVASPDIFRGRFRRNPSMTFWRFITHRSSATGKKRARDMCSIDRRVIIASDVCDCGDSPCACSMGSVDHGIFHININTRLILSLLKSASATDVEYSTQQDSKSHPRELSSRTSWNRYLRSTPPMASFHVAKQPHHRVFLMSSGSSTRKRSRHFADSKLRVTCQKGRSDLTPHGTLG